MSIATKCTCGKSPMYCIGGEGCYWENNTSFDKVLFGPPKQTIEEDKEELKQIAQQLNDLKYGTIPTQLTYKQKLEAIAAKYYMGGIKWEPKTGDYYTTCRADLELYQIVEANETEIITKYCDPSRGNATSTWKRDGFLIGFGHNRVYVSPIALSIN